MSRKMFNLFKLTTLCFLLILLPPFAQSAEEVPTADESDLQWFRDAKFGLFIHWGPVSQVGTEIGWSRGGERKFPKGKGQIPVAIYDNLYRQFNPTQFDAQEWVEVAEQAGMKYLVFTTKHHDGFCMFDSKLTDYKITNSPFGRDVTGLLAEACHQAGIKLGFYHSPPDWHHPDYFTDNHEKYIEYLHGQVKELCSNYGSVSILWFDGLGGKPEYWDSPSMIRMIRELQPGIIINNRAGLPQDFDTPEQRVGRFQSERPWESCITICQQWAWKPNDKLKSLKECIDILVRCVGGDGNLLLNVGPMPNGEIEQRQINRLKEIGQWLKKYGKSIYNTRGGPFKPGQWGASTYEGNTIYLHILDWLNEETLKFPGISQQIVRSQTLTGGKAIVKQDEGGIKVTLPSKHHDPLDTIIALQLDGPAKEITPLSVERYHSLAYDKSAKASNVFRNQTHSYGPDKAFDEDMGTRWATDSGTSQAWLSVNLGESKTFDQIHIYEEYDRIKAFELQYKEQNEWITFHKGITIGDHFKLKVDPITARQIRLKINDATEGPTIWEFHVFKSTEK